MRRKVELEGDKSMAQRSMEFYQTAEEDYAFLEFARSTGFRYYGNSCMTAARYAEKMMKARLLRMGIDPDWGHDLPALVSKFPHFDGFSRAMELATLLDSYGTQAAYPSLVRDSLTPEAAAAAYDWTMELVALTSQFDADGGRGPETHQTKLFSLRSRRRGRRCTIDSGTRCPFHTCERRMGDDLPGQFHESASTIND